MSRYSSRSFLGPPRRVPLRIGREFQSPLEADPPPWRRPAVYILVVFDVNGGQKQAGLTQVLLFLFSSKHPYQTGRWVTTMYNSPSCCPLFHHVPIPDQVFSRFSPQMNTHNRNAHRLFCIDRSFIVYGMLPVLQCWYMLCLRCVVDPVKRTTDLGQPEQAIMRPWRTHLIRWFHILII